MHRRIDVAEIPLVRRDLSIGLHVPFPCQQVQLFLCKGRVYDSQRDTMEGRVPSSEEGVLPSDDLALVHRQSDSKMIAYLSGIERMSAICI